MMMIMMIMHWKMKRRLNQIDTTLFLDPVCSVYLFMSALLWKIIIFVTHNIYIHKTDEGRCDIYMNVNIGGPRRWSPLFIFIHYYRAAAAAAAGGAKLI